MVAFRLPATGKAVTDLTVLPTVSKSRKPKFELHLKIYDLNNVPLVSGASIVKWQLPYSLHSEHRGRTAKHPITNHRVEYNYAKIIPLRLVVDRSNRLSDYPIEFEIIQEFDNANNKEEKTVLGKITLNLAEYVAESETILRDARPSTGDSRNSLFTFESAYGTAAAAAGRFHARQRSSLSTKATLSSFGTNPGTTTLDTLAAEAAALSTSPSASGNTLPPPPSTAGSSTTSVSTPAASLVDDGVVRRYLMQDSKINSTLKISVLMVQIDGERNFIAPALKTAPVFGGIAGVVANGEAMGSSGVALDDADDLGVPGVGAGGSLFAASRGRDANEVHDVYRRALAASWACQAGELSADECIEDIFNGGDGFRSSTMTSSTSGTARPPSTLGSVVEGSDGSTPSPTLSTGNDKDGEGSTSSGSKKAASRIIPRIPGIRRKGLPTQLHIGKARAAKDGDKRTVSGGTEGSNSSLLFESGSNNTSSGDDGERSGTYSGSGNNDDDEGVADANATMRPRDLRRLRTQATSSSSSAIATMRARDDSVFSDRTVTPPQSERGLDMLPRSCRSSPAPLTIPSSPRRDASYGSSVSAATRRSRDRSAGKASSSDGRRGSGKHHGGGPGGISAQGPGSDEHTRRARLVDEYEVRDDLVAWQLPGSVATS